MALLTQIFRNGTSDALGASDARFQLPRNVLVAGRLRVEHRRDHPQGRWVLHLWLPASQTVGPGPPFECSTASKAGPKAQSNHVGRSPAGRYRDSDARVVMLQRSSRLGPHLRLRSSHSVWTGPSGRPGPHRLAHDAKNSETHETVVDTLVAPARWRSPTFASLR